MALLKAFFVLRVVKNEFNIYTRLFFCVSLLIDWRKSNKFIGLCCATKSELRANLNLWIRKKIRKSTSFGTFFFSFYLNKKKTVSDVVRDQEKKKVYILIMISKQNIFNMILLSAKSLYSCAKYMTFKII